MTACARTTILTGMTPEQLRASLAQAQADYIALLSGNKGESFSYTQGDGGKSVTYTRGDLAGLVNLIGMMQQMLGIGGRRRPIYPQF